MADREQGAVSPRELLALAERVSAGTSTADDANRVRRAADQLASRPAVRPVGNIQAPGVGIRRIAAERMRQVEEEGYEPESDAMTYLDGQLARAAACYALPWTDHRRRDASNFNTAPEGWPFGQKAWKPARTRILFDGHTIIGQQSLERIRELEKAGALIAAQIDVICLQEGITPDGATDPLDVFLAEVRAEVLRARVKFPGDRLTTLALSEEYGELCKAILDEPSADVRKEAVQTAAMTARVVLDGDSSVRTWREQRGLDALPGGTP